MQPGRNAAGKTGILVQRPRAPLVARIWRGRTRAADAERYLDYIYETGILPIEAKPGCLGVQLFRRPLGEETEFVTISYWRSEADMAAMHEEAGRDPRRVAHLDEDPDYLTVMPEFVEVAELHVNDWRIDA